MSDPTRYRSVFDRRNPKTLAAKIPATNCEDSGFATQCAQLAFSLRRGCLPTKDPIADSGGHSAAPPRPRFRANAPIFSARVRVSLHLAKRASSTKMRRSVVYSPSAHREDDLGHGFEDNGLEHGPPRRLEPYPERSPST